MTMENGGTSNGNNDIDMAVEEEEDLMPSLIIPITSSEKSSDLVVEIFPEEFSNLPSSTMLQVLKDEDADLQIWADAALMYVQQKQSRESSAILQSACEQPGGDREKRILASAGIALLTQAQQSQSRAPGGIRRPGSGDSKDELCSKADSRFTHASKVDTLFPMTWIGRGMLNLNFGRLDQARFFFDTALKQCGPVLPALLGMACVLHGEKDYKATQETYAKAMRLYPQKSGASTRVGFGVACYRLGQIDRAKAAFARALEMDGENVEAMVGAAILDMASLDETSKDFNSRAEKAINMISMANLLDHSNAMVQNHLANHYFWKWAPVSGAVQVTQGSNVVKGSQPIPLDRGEHIRIGTDFETYVTEESTGDEEEDRKAFKINDAWKDASAGNLKVWKKDYERVIDLAKSAYSSTTVQEIQAESLFFLARVYHVREEVENALKFYEKSVRLAPDLSPARFGLAQILIMQDKYDDAAEHLRKVIEMSPKATDALALLGLLKVKAAKNVMEGKSPQALAKGKSATKPGPEGKGNQEAKNAQEGLSFLRQAIDIDPLNPDLVVLEALALQQHESDYPRSLERYKKAVSLIERRGKKIPYEIYTNIGVLCHETKKYDTALDMYKLAFKALDEDGTAQEVSLENREIEGGRIVSKENELFYGFADTKLQVERSSGLVLKVHGASESEESSLPVSAGDHVRVGDSFESEIVNIEKKDDSHLIHIKDEFVDDDGESGKENEESTEEAKKEGKKYNLFVKRSNRRLENPKAISIAFNLARLHEAVGRILAAVEMHKAIVKRNPAYVNSYLRLACIAVDCGCLKECSEWLKIAAETTPGNPEVLTLIGNLHLSLCDWAPAQAVFDDLLFKKVPNVQAYSMLSLGNIYFANLRGVSAGRYAKHLLYASDYYKPILMKDPSNAYAANGLGTVIAEKGELYKAKEVFNRVREVSGDTVADALLNLGHIHLAQKKHPEALQMYGSYMKRTEDGSVPITSKSRVDDLAEVLLYIAFAYFDWARHTELFNNAKAAPADERYKEAMKHLELALSKNSKKDVVLRYNLCMTKLQAGNCILQKLTRNIRRTAKEVEDALQGLEESYTQVEELLKDKKSEQKKVPIPTSTLQSFLRHCKANIASAKSHLADERKREEEANTERELQRLAAEAQRKEEAIRVELEKQEKQKKQEERDRKAEEKMRQVDALRVNWQRTMEAKKAVQEKNSKKVDRDFIVEDGEGEDDDDADENAQPTQQGLFEDSDSDDESGQEKTLDDANEEKNTEEAAPEADAGETTQKELFGDSDDEESDEELLPTEKRKNDAASDDDEQPAKKRRVEDDDA